MQPERAEAVQVFYDAVLEGNERREDMVDFFRRAMLGVPTEADENFLTSLLRRAGVEGTPEHEEDIEPEAPQAWLYDLAACAGLELAFRNWLPLPTRQREDLEGMARLYRMRSPRWMALPNIIIRFAGVRSGKWLRRKGIVAELEGKSSP